MTGISPEEKEAFLKKQRKGMERQKTLKEMEEELDDDIIIANAVIKIETNER